MARRGLAVDFVRRDKHRYLTLSRCLGGATRGAQRWDVPLKEIDGDC
jgi:hypothetical protein